MLLPTHNPLNLPWSNQPALPSSPRDPERWSQAQATVRDPLVPPRSMEGEVVPLSWQGLPAGCCSGEHGPGIGGLPAVAYSPRVCELGPPHLALDDKAAHPGLFSGQAYMVGASHRPSLAAGETSLLSKSQSPYRVSSPAHWQGEQGRPGSRAGRRRPPVAMALSPPISGCIAASPGQGVWLRGGSGWHG